MSKKYALIIGNTEYGDPGLAQLTAPGKDAEDFGRILESKDICGFDEVKISLNQSSGSVIELIDGLFDQKKPDDMLVLYFSGHGVKDESGSLYLAFKNTVRSRLRSTAIKSDYIREAMEQSRSKRQVLILDCCNSGAFPQGTKAETGGPMGLTQAFQGYGRFVLTASDSTQFAWEGDKVIGETNNSLFTHFLVKGLEGEADSDGDGRITVDELYDYAYAQVSKVTPKQTPTKSSSRQEGEIILRENMRIEDIKPVPLPTALLDSIENPFTDVRLGAVKQLTKLLNGKNLGMARSAKEALGRIAENDDSRQVQYAAFQALEAILQEKQKVEEELTAKEEAQRLATQKAKEDPIAAEKAESQRRAVERLVAQKAEEDRLAKEEGARRKAQDEIVNKVVVHGKNENIRVSPSETTNPQPTIQRQPFSKWVVIGIIGFIFGVGIIVAYLEGLGGATPAITEIPSATKTKTETPTSANNIIPTPGVGSTVLGKKGETLVYVPAGEFSMGSGSGFNSDERPIHTVYLDAFWIDQTEVTNKQYQACVDAGTCEPPSSSNSPTHPSYYENPEFDNYPVLYVNWDKANRYCEVWAGGDLPTEAQWEKAARGTDERTYPWGENINCDKANYQKGCVGDTSSVHSYENGKSPYNAYDMAGNVWEWVNDYYQSDYYTVLGDSVSNPQGPLSGTAHVLRGGSWSYFDDFSRSANRYAESPNASNSSVGFRCVNPIP